MFQSLVGVMQTFACLPRAEDAGGWGPVGLGLGLGLGLGAEGGSEAGVGGGLGQRAWGHSVPRKMIREANVQQANVQQPNVQQPNIRQAKVQQAKVRQANVWWTNVRWTNVQQANYLEPGVGSFGCYICTLIRILANKGAMCKHQLKRSYVAAISR